MANFDFSSWGIEKALLRNIIIGFILILLAQMSTLALYFRSELDKAQGRVDALELEYRACMEAAQAKIEELKNDHLRAIEKAAERQDKLERTIKRKLR